MSGYGFWLSAAGMKVNEYRQAIHANNLASAQTSGFKRDLAVVAERRIESQSRTGGFGFAHPVLDGMTGGVDVQPTFQSFEQGSIEQTGRPLDVAVDGEGFFAVREGDATRYTRDGKFALNSRNELVLSAAGGRWKVLSDSENPIVIDPIGGAIAVSRDGTLRQGQTVVDRIGLKTTDNLQGLRKVGENLFEAQDVEMRPIDGRFVAGALEKSNYDMMKGLTSMIEASRAYQLNATMIQLQDRVTGEVTAIGRLA